MMLSCNGITVAISRAGRKEKGEYWLTIQPVENPVQIETGATILVNREQLKALADGFALLQKTDPIV